MDVPMITADSERENTRGGLAREECASAEQDPQVNSDGHHVSQLAYESEASYTGDQQKTLMEVLNYCQAMYDAIQKLDKKFDSLHQKVSEMQHSRLKPLLFMPRSYGLTCRSFGNLSPGKIRIQKPTERRSSVRILPPKHGCLSPPVKVRIQRACDQASPVADPVPHTLQFEAQQVAHRQSPPLPTIVSTHSLCPPFNVSSMMPDLPLQTSLTTTVSKSPSDETASAIASTVAPSPESSWERNSMTMTYEPSHESADIPNEVSTSFSSNSTSPAIASSHSLYPPFSTANEIPNFSSQSSFEATVMESPAAVSSSAISSPMVSSWLSPGTSLGRNNLTATCRTSSGSTNISSEMPSSSINPNFEFVGDPKRNVKVLGNYLMKARQKTRPKYAACYLVRVLFPKETLLCSAVGVRTPGRKILDPNKIAAIREFLATFFPNYDLREHGRDWKTCITNVNAMIHRLRCETNSNPEEAGGKEKTPDVPDTSMYVDLVHQDNGSEVSSPTTLKMVSSTSNQLQNSVWDNNLPEVLPLSNKIQPLEPMTFLGNPLRNVRLPLSIIYVARGKSRPELSARYLIRHLYTEDVLVKSSVYGNLDRGTYPLEHNKINALRDFLQDNYPSFDLKETGYDWKACVAAINSTIRSLRYDHKRASTEIRTRLLDVAP